MVDFLKIVFSFPVAIFFVPYCFFLALMILSLITGFLEDFHLPFNADMGDLGADVEAEAIPNQTHISDNLLLPVTVTQVPLPIALTVIFFIASLLIYGANLGVHTQADFLYWPLILVSLVFCFWLSLHISALILKPFIPIFDKNNTLAIVKYEGKVGIVKTSIVTQHTGEVIILDESLENQIDVYTEQGDDVLKYGDKALVVYFNQDTHRYLVIQHHD